MFKTILIAWGLAAAAGLLIGETVVYLAETWDAKSSRRAPKRALMRVERRAA